MAPRLKARLSRPRCCTPHEASQPRGALYRAKGDTARAIADYTKAIDINPSCADACFARANILRDMGSFEKAIADYTRVVEIRPKDADAHNNRAWAYYSAGDPLRAWRMLGKRCASTPTTRLRSTRAAM